MHAKRLDKLPDSETPQRRVATAEAYEVVAQVEARVGPHLGRAKFVPAGGAGQNA